MKKKLIGISAACLLVAGGSVLQARADKVPLAQLPEPVQKAIKQHSQGENLETVERESKDGQTVYEAEFKREGLNRHITFAADGSVVHEKHITNLFSKEPSMTVNELPAAVQKTVKEQQAGRDVADIDREMWNGKTVYEVEFKEKGPNSRIYIATDGSIVMDKEKKHVYLGTQFSEVPPAVQATVNRVVSSAEIEDVDHRTKDGQSVYYVEVKQKGLNRHLKIAENGTLLADSNDRDNRGIGERVREKLGLDHDASTVTLDQVPAAVQKTIKEAGDLGNMKPIKRELRYGRTQYDVEFEKSGKNTRMTIGEDGTILKDNR